MNRSAEKQVKTALRLYEVGRLDEALQMLDDVIQKESDPSIKFGLLYYEMMLFLEAGTVSQAREKFHEMRAQMSFVDNSAEPKNPLASSTVSPQDTDQNDLEAYLAVIASFAEAKLLIKERNEALALSALEDLMSRYPKQLSLRKLRELRGEAEMHRGMLLANADRWLEAGEFLERAIPPKNLRPIFRFYLGQYYFTIRDYKRAAKNLNESITKDMPPQWRYPAHYMLGLAEYDLSHVKEAKKQFELSARIADPDYIRKNNLWGWLERTSHALGQDVDAAKYRKIRKDQENHDN